MSFGGKGRGSVIGNELLDILGNYMLFVASAGNSNEGHASYWPACHELVLPVGAHNISGNRSVWVGGKASNFQPYVLLSAPGTGVWAPDMIGMTVNGLYHKGYISPSEDEFGECMLFAGTSASAPVVSGIAALTLCVNPSLNASALKQRLLETRRTPMADPLNWGGGLGVGIVDGYNAVTGSIP